VALAEAKQTCKTIRITRAADGKVIADRADRAEGLWTRCKGLLGRRSLKGGQGMLIEPCNGIHTLGMRFPIDVIVLDSEGVILRLVSRVQPWRFVLPMRGGRAVVEIAGGEIEAAGLRVGEKLTWSPERR
jgi:uncharacterized protein